MVELVGKHWMEMECVAAQLEASVAPLQQIDGSGHGAEVNALGFGAALDVVDVAAQRFGKERPGAASAGARENPGVDNPAKSRAMRRPPQIIVDCIGDQRTIEDIAKPRKELGELFGGEQVEEHEDVGLLRYFVAIGRIAFRLKDQIEAHDVAVFAPIRRPVKLLQR